MIRVVFGILDHLHGGDAERLRGACHNEMTAVSTLGVS